MTLEESLKAYIEENLVRDKKPITLDEPPGADEPREARTDDDDVGVERHDRSSRRRFGIRPSQSSAAIRLGYV